MRPLQIINSLSLPGLAASLQRSKINLGFDWHTCHEEQSKLQQLRVLSSSIVLSASTQDVPTWRWNSSGKLLVRSAADFLSYDGINNTTLPFLWKLKVPLKVKLFFWLALCNKILTGDNLAKRRWHGPTICVLCFQEAEKLQHIILYCSYTRSIWNWLNIRTSSTLVSNSTPPDGIATRWCHLRTNEGGENITSFDLTFAATCWEL